MKYVLALCLSCALLVSSPHAQTPPATPDPSVAQIQAVMGPETAVNRNGPGDYTIDDEHVTYAQLVGTILPQKESALKAIQANIQQRQEIERQATSGVSLDAKRAQCQKLADNSIERTRCYQELADLRDRQAQSSADQQDKQKDDELQSDRLVQEIGAIEQFKKQFGAK